ncbi:MAG TPA: KEOPS complex subunit Pcc1 [Methanomassiliicoccales archaeon]|nr:KEOPS complex subunit Pcc1 [Methanomassiliicoccales archaeon]
MPSAVLRLATPDAATVYGALSPEAGREIPRTKVRASMEAGKMVLRIDATDLSALRAALNSYLRWIMVAEEVDSMAGA